MDNCIIRMVLGGYPTTSILRKYFNFKTIFYQVN